jgi:hypothetical protein
MLICFNTTSLKIPKWWPCELVKWEVHMLYLEKVNEVLVGEVLFNEFSDCGSFWLSYCFCKYHNILLKFLNLISYK